MSWMQKITDNTKAGQKKFFEILKNNPKLEIGLYVLIAVIVLILIFGWQNGENKDAADRAEQSVKAEEQSGESQEAGDELEQKLKTTLQKISGAGEVEVLISYATSSEIVPAQSVETQSSTNGDSGTSSESQSSQPVTVQQENGDAPMVLVEIEPQIRGVIIVAEGADNISVKMNLLRAAQTALDIPASKVEVFSMDTVPAEDSRQLQGQP